MALAGTKPESYEREKDVVNALDGFGARAEVVKELRAKLDALVKWPRFAGVRGRNGRAASTCHRGRRTPVAVRRGVASELRVPAPAD
jgi:hypothetical protein